MKWKGLIPHLNWNLQTQRHFKNKKKCHANQRGKQSIPLFWNQSLIFTTTLLAWFSLGKRYKLVSELPRSRLKVDQTQTCNLDSNLFMFEFELKQNQFFYLRWRLIFSIYSMHRPVVNYNLRVLCEIIYQFFLWKPKIAEYENKRKN